MIHYKSLTLSFLLLFSLISCNSKDDDSGISCSFREEHFGGTSTETYNLGQKAAQRFILNRSMSLSTITLEMDLLNSQTVTMTVLKLTPTGTQLPTNSTEIARATINSGSVANIGKITFSFNSPRLEGGEYYYIIEALGGSFEITKQSAWPFDIYGEVWKLSGGAWTKDTNYDFSFAAAGGC